VGIGAGTSSWPCCWSRTVDSSNLGIEIRHDTLSISVWFPRGKLSIVRYRPAWQTSHLLTYLTYCLAFYSSDSEWRYSKKGNYNVLYDMTVIILNVRQTEFRMSAVVTSSKFGWIIRKSSGNSEKSAYNILVLKNKRW